MEVPQETEPGARTNCRACGADLGGRVLHGEVLFVDDIITILSGKASRATLNRWLAGPLLSGGKTIGIRGRWILVIGLEAYLKRLGCALRLATACPTCDAPLDGYLIRGELLDAQDVVEYFSSRITLATAQTWFKRKLIRGRKTPGIRGYWTTVAEFREDVRRLKASPAGLTPRVIARG